MLPHETKFTKSVSCHVRRPRINIEGKKSKETQLFLTFDPEQDSKIRIRSKPDRNQSKLTVCNAIKK